MIKTFDHSTAPYFHSILVVGKRAVGKSTLVKDLLTQINSSENILVTDLENKNSLYNGLVSDNNHFTPYSNEVVNKIIQQQKLQLKTSERNV